MSSRQGHEGEIITPEEHFAASSQNARETFGVTGLDNFSLMRYLRYAA